jgi:Tripartite tricarboxylate transporter family receptor
MLTINRNSRARVGRVAPLRARSSAPTRRRLIKALATGVAAPTVLRITGALAAYPERTVRIVVANSPGGPSDIIARIMAAALQEATGTAFIVENRGGGGGNIGMGLVARSEPDGCTILLATSAYAVNPSLFETLPYDPVKDFVAIAELATSPNVFAVKPELGVGTIKEFVTIAKQDPDKFNVSTPPIGTTPHLQAELFKARESLGRMATVTHAGGGEALKALLGSTVQLNSGVLAPAHPHIKSGSSQGPGGHRRDALVRSAGHPDHAGGWLQGLCIRDLHIPYGASENAARKCGLAGRRVPQGHATPGAAQQIGRVWLRGPGQGRQDAYGTHCQGGAHVRRDYR